MREAGGAIHLTTHERSRAVELSCECDALGKEVERLTAELIALQERECAVHGLLNKRVAVMRTDQRELSGLLDGVALR